MAPMEMFHIFQTNEPNLINDIQQHEHAYLVYKLNGCFLKAVVAAQTDRQTNRRKPKTFPVFIVSFQ